MPRSLSLALATACVLGVPAAFGLVTLHTVVVETSSRDRVVCAVSNTADVSVLVDAMRIKDGAGTVRAFRPPTTVAPMATVSLQLWGSGQRRCEVDVDDFDADAVRVRIYNVLSGRSNDGG